MGLTVHYQLSLPQPLSPEAVEKLVGTVHAKARDLVEREKLTRISSLIPATAHPMTTFFTPAGPEDDQWIGVEPLAGRCFAVTLGPGSEIALFGLCRYPATAATAHGTVHTKRGDGWSFQAFCKTQYATLHGWDNFFRCHRAVIDLALLWQEHDVKTTITDEGDYWPARNGEILRARVDRLNRIVAAVGGRLKDADQHVKSPIFDHPRFERLEAEGIPELDRLLEPEN